MPLLRQHGKVINTRTGEIYHNRFREARHFRLTVLFTAIAACLALAALAAPNHERGQVLNPRQQAIIQLACDHPTDGVLNWAKNQGLTVNLQEDC